MKIRNKTFLNLCIAVNVLIPKAGFKVAGIPLTLGFVLICILFIKTFAKKFVIEQKDLQIVCCLMAFPVYSMLRVIIPYFGGNVNLSDVLGRIAVTTLSPLIFVVIVTKINDEEQINAIIELMIGCFLLTMLYAVLQFVFGIKNTQIPGISVNYADYIQAPDRWWLLKHNTLHTDNISKVFSTYQNGNIYGITILMLYPILDFYIANNKSLIVRAFLFSIFVLISFLTGSRTVWIGVIVYVMILLFSVIKARKIKVRNLRIIAAMVVVLPLMSYLILKSGISLPIGRLIYSLNWANFIKGSGRTDGLIFSLKHAFTDGSIIYYLFGFYGTDIPVSASEMTYFAILFAYGITGLFFFSLPILCIMQRIKLFKNRDMLTNSLYRGLFIYFLIAFIEGAYWTPPTAVNLWTLTALAYKKTKFPS